MRTPRYFTLDSRRTYLFFSFIYQTCKVLVDKQVAFGKDEILQSWIFFILRVSLLAVSQL